jgi:hypothetical protein
MAQTHCSWPRTTQLYTGPDSPQRRERVKIEDAAMSGQKLNHSGLGVY